MMRFVLSPTVNICARGSIAALSRRHLPITFMAGFVVAMALTVVTIGRVPGDLALSRFFWSFNDDWLVELMLFGDALGGNLWLFTLLGTALVGLLVMKRWSYAAMLAVASSFFVMSPLLKETIQRPRPWVDGYQAIINPAGYSFPSGHALGSGLIIGGMTLVLVMLLRGRPVFQAVAGAAGLSLLAIIGASRVYLGAHWTSDVIAGYTLAALFLLVAFRVTGLASSRRAEVPVE